MIFLIVIKQLSLLVSASRLIVQSLARWREFPGEPWQTVWLIRRN